MISKKENNVNNSGDMKIENYLCREKNLRIFKIVFVWNIYICLFLILIIISKKEIKKDLIFWRNENVKGILPI